jgi:hypothetical protein
MDVIVKNCIEVVVTEKSDLCICNSFRLYCRGTEKPDPDVDKPDHNFEFELVELEKSDK